MKVVNLLPSILKKSSASKPTKSKTTKKGKGIVTGTLKVVFFFFFFFSSIRGEPFPSWKYNSREHSFSCCEVSFH